MRDSSDNLFANLTISNARKFGVFLSNVENHDTCPVNNEFRDLTIVDSKLSAFRLNSECENNRLTGRTIFRGNLGGCIEETTSVKLGVTGNYLCE